MRRALSLLALIGLAACAGGPTETSPPPPPPPPPTLSQEATATHPLTVDGKDREFIGDPPAGVLSAALPPTVFMRHGTSGG
ncbi:MAG: polyhydroxybutyrate depolymerase, partial [Gemmatimonadales bacterium]